jgi:hypothetical protein
MKPTFAAKKFLTSTFVNCQGLHAHLTDAGYTVPLDTVRKWFVRGSIPTEWLVALLVSENNAISLKKYVGERKCRSSRKKSSHSGEPLDVFD